MVFGRGFNSRRLHHFSALNKRLSVSGAARLHNVSKRGDRNRLVKQPDLRVNRRRGQVRVPLRCAQVGMPREFLNRPHGRSASLNNLLSAPNY